MIAKEHTPSHSMQRIIYFDIDDTLVRSFGQKRIPMPAVISQIRRLKNEGCTLYLWSSGGAEYCKATALELGVADCFDGFLAKPTVYVDDQPMHEWKLFKHLISVKSRKCLMHLNLFLTT